MRAKLKEELEEGDEIVIFEPFPKKGGRRFFVHKVTEITEEDVIVDNVYDITPNEDGHYFVLPK